MLYYAPITFFKYPVLYFSAVKSKELKDLTRSYVAPARYRTIDLK